MKKCRDVMTKDPKCLSPSDSVQAAAQQMKEEDVGSLLICEPSSRELLGIVTDRDLAVKILASGLNPATAVETVMTHDPVCCLENEAADKAITLMAQHQVRRLPVIDDDARLVGIISQGDIATRIGEPKKTAEVVKEVSQPPSSTYREEHAA